MSHPNIKILGVGNVLFGDDGFGVRVVERIKNEYELSPPVEVIDGGTQGMFLLGHLDDCDIIYIIDCAHMGKEPGTLYRFNSDAVPFKVPYKSSVGQIAILETLKIAILSGNKFDSIILAIEPKNFESVNTSLTPKVEGKIDEVIDILKQELDQFGITLRKKTMH